ncbi:hypothetical protein ACS0TY_022024 [Phlomoides rotata]
MKVLLWNIRGVGNDIPRNLLKSHCSQHRPDWLVLLESKVYSADICRNYLRSLNFVLFAENQRPNKLPNICLFCSIPAAAMVTVIGSSKQAIISFISGFCCSNLCLVGDFNAVLGAHERISSWAPSSVSCADFQGFIEQEEIFEVEAAGANFTWASRCLGQGLIASKLDRIFAHDSFIGHWDMFFLQPFLPSQVYNLGDSDQLLDRKIEATLVLNRILKQEQLFYAQKNRVSLLKDGDLNTAFFQRLHRVKKARPGINSLYIDRILSTDQGAICAHIEAYYSSLFRGSTDGTDMERVREIIAPTVLEAQCYELSCI